MNKYIITIVIFYIGCCCISCKRAKTVTTKDDEISVSKASNDELNNFLTIPIFSKYSNYDNNLSTVASDIRFIPLDKEPPISSFHICDIQLAENCFFLSTISSIMQYDKNGKYIKNIGKKGSGPEEYINISYPLQIDQTNNLVYATDLNRQRVVVYNFDGKLEKTFPLRGGSSITLIDTSLIALRQTISERGQPDCSLIRFINDQGKEIKKYRSNYYPLSMDDTESFGSDMSPLWKSKKAFYYHEYGTDTIFRISKDSLIPARKLIGDLKADFKQHFKRDIGNNLMVLTYIMRPNSGIFESDQFLTFRLCSQNESFFAMYNKETGEMHRTLHKDAVETRTGSKKMDYFIDDIVSGLEINPVYQSDGKAIALISAADICDRKQEILDFIKNHPNEESENLNLIIQQITDDDNPLMVVVSFK